MSHSLHPITVCHFALKVNHWTSYLASVGRFVDRASLIDMPTPPTRVSVSVPWTGVSMDRNGLYVSHIAILTGVYDCVVKKGPIPCMFG